MSDMPLVSVIVIFLDAERFIQEAIDSLLAQTYEAWELLLVDDGSTDGSTTIARRYAEQFPGRIRYLEHPDHQNRGMSSSRNLGIANANGQFIAFLDADDVWLPRKLELQVAALDARPEAGMVYGPTQWWYSWTGKPDDLHRDFIHELGVAPGTLLQPPALLTRFLRTEGISPCTCSVLVRGEIARRVGGFEESFRGLYEDQAFFAKVCLVAPVFVSPECLARYRQHPDSNYAVTQEAGQYPTARRSFLEWLEAYLAKQGVQAAGVSEALRNEMLPYRHPVPYRLLQAARHGWPGRIYRAIGELRLRWLSLPIIRQLRVLQFRRLAPLGDGRQRGTAIVRYYWSRFLQEYRADIRGRALEIGTTFTIRQYGGGAVSSAEAMDLSAHSPDITVVADLSRADQVPSDSYDCFVNQFTMHLIYDVEAAVYQAIRILKPGGVLLVNFPCVDYYFPSGLDMGTGEPLFLYWWFTPVQVENLLRRAGLQAGDYHVKIYGNLFARIAYQMNMPAEELTQHELDYSDPGHPLLICVRAVKPANWQASKPTYREPWLPGTIPAQWDPETGHYAAGRG